MKVKWKLTNFEFFSGEDPRDPQEVMNNVQIGETANGVTKVTGLTVEGVYTFKATAVDCTAEPPCSETVTLTKESVRLVRLVEPLFLTQMEMRNMSFRQVRMV